MSKTVPKISWKERMRLSSFEPQTKVQPTLWQDYITLKYAPLSAPCIIEELERLHVLYGTDEEGFWCHSSLMLAPGHRASICERYEELTRYVQTETYYTNLSPPVGYERFPCADTLRDLRRKRTQGTQQESERRDGSDLERIVLDTAPSTGHELGDEPLRTLSCDRVGQDTEPARLRVLPPQARFGFIEWSK